MELITKAEYARRRGVTKPAVQKAVATGRIVLIDGKIDPEQADRQWNERTNRKQQRQKSASEGGPEDKPEDRKAVPGETFSQAQTRKEIALANLREKEDRLKAGELIATAEVRATWVQVGVSIRDSVMGLPVRVCNRVPAEWRRELAAVLEDEARKLLTALSNEIRTDSRAA